MSKETYVQSYAPDKMKLAELLIKAKGPSRTMAQFSELTGINTSTLSRIANGKISKPLTSEMLTTIFENRDGSAEFTLNTLMLANGTVDQTAIEKGRAFTEQLLSRQEQGFEIERRAKNAIIAALMSRGVAVQTIPTDMDRRRNEHPYSIAAPYDFCFYLLDAPESCWYFEVTGGKHYQPVGSGVIVNKAARLFLLDAWEPDYLRGSKTSFVFTHRYAYQQFILRFQGAPIKSAVSAILVNIDKEEFIEETVMTASPTTESILSRPVVDGGYIATWADEDGYESDDFSEDNE